MIFIRLIHLPHKISLFITIGNFVHATAPSTGKSVPQRVFIVELFPHPVLPINTTVGHFLSKTNSLCRLITPSIIAFF